MTTDQRNRVYFPAWRPFAKARGWVMKDGRLVADLAAQRAATISSPAREELIRVLDLAESIAGKSHRAVTATEPANDLRHACNYVATKGRTMSSDPMNNRDLNQFLRLLRLLADPDDLTAVGDWLNPAEADRKDYVRWMARTMKEATLIAIARNTWDTADWESRTMDQLKWLSRTYRDQQERRGASFRRTVEQQNAPGSAPADPDNEPF